MRLARSRRFLVPTLVGIVALMLMGAEGDPPLTFASFLTPTGIIAAAALVTGTVQLIKSVVPAIDARVSGALMAFVLTAILYVLAGIATGVSSLDAGLVVFAAWLACATSSVGIKATSDHVTANSSAG